MCSLSRGTGETETKLYHEMSYASAASCAADRALYGDRLLTSAAGMATGECGALNGVAAGGVGATLAPCGCATYVTRRDLNSTLPPGTMISSGNGMQLSDQQRASIVPAYFLLRDGATARNTDDDIPPPPPHRLSPEPSTATASLAGNENDYKPCDNAPSHQ